MANTIVVSIRSYRSISRFLIGCYLGYNNTNREECTQVDRPISFYDESLKKQIEASFYRMASQFMSVSYTALRVCPIRSWRMHRLHAQVLLVQKPLSEMALDGART